MASNEANTEKRASAAAEQRAEFFEKFGLNTDLSCRHKKARLSGGLLCR